MKKFKRLGIGLGLILVGMSGTVQAQSVYTTTIPSLNGTMFQIGLADTIDHELSAPKPKPPAPPVSTSNDFNGDGRADVLLHDSKTGDVALWLIDPNNKIRAVTIATNVPPDTIKAVADFNGDGRADVLLHDSKTGDVGMLLMNADGTAQNVHITSGGNLVKIAPGWQFGAVLDFNGDGRADLFWRSCDGKKIDVWFMNGATIVNSGVIEDVPLQWQLVPGPRVDPLDCPSG